MGGFFVLVNAEIPVFMKIIKVSIPTFMKKDKKTL